MSAPDDQDQRTLPPTEKRIRDFRKRGEIALSKELAQVGSLGLGLVALLASLPAIAEVCRRLTIGVLRDPGRAVDVTLGDSRDALVAASAPVLIATVAGFVVAAGVQLGWPPAFKKLSFDPSKLVSLAAIGELLSPKALARRLAVSTLRLGAALAAAALAVYPEVARLQQAPSLDGAAALRALAGATGRVVLVTGAVLAALAAFDYVRSRRLIGARMKMTLEEYKREHREQEGDPQVKRRRRQRMRELARRRLATAVASADVVIVNPTEYAVALRYQADKDRAPRVVAKGRGEAAQRIRDLARAAGVPILAQPPLARLIHKLVPEGREIPGTLYHAVAEVLGYVYRLRRKARGGRA